MRWATAVSGRSALDQAIDEASARLLDALGGARPDLILAFVSGHASAAERQQLRSLSDRFPGVPLAGCTAGGVIGGGDEIEGRSAVSLLAGVLPGVEVRVTHLTPRDLDPGRLEPGFWGRLLGVTQAHQPSFLLLADPLSCDTERLLSSMDTAFPAATKVGGLASGARTGQRNALLANQTIAEAGVVVVSLVGDVAVDAVVAQGCRPLGAPMVVTRSERNLILELDGKPAMEAFDAFFASLSPADRALFQRGPMVGIGIDPGKASYRRGDFLVRDLIGVDRDRGVLGVAAAIRSRQVIQLHARDRQTSSDDLHELLGRYRREHADNLAVGAVIFSCVGRGQGLFGVARHDSRVFRQHVGPAPLGGFFCGGEIGPVHNRTFLHGYTSAFGLFRPAGWN